MSSLGLGLEGQVLGLEAEVLVNNTDKILPAQFGRVEFWA